MVDVARKHKRVVQVGTQQRSGPHYPRRRELLRDGHIGKIARCGCGVPQHHAGLRQPARRRPARRARLGHVARPGPEAARTIRNRALYHFRWFWDYSGGQMTNLRAHELDIVQWITGRSADASRARSGNAVRSRASARRRMCSRTFTRIPGFLADLVEREVSAGRWRGSKSAAPKGSLTIDRRGFEIAPDKAIPADNQIPRYTFSSGRNRRPATAPKR